MINELRSTRQINDKANKPWRRNSSSYGSAVELALCGVCANSFYHMEDYHIRRVDRYQIYKDTCCMCGARFGFDYLVYDYSRNNSICA